VNYDLNLAPCAVGLGLIGLVLTGTSAHADSQQIYLRCLTNFEAYAETIWHTASYSKAPADAGYWGDGGSSGNGGIRGNGGIAVAYAVLVVAYPDDPKLPTRLSRLRQALNYNAGTHVSGTNLCVDGHQWGWSSWTSGERQTSEWAASMGLACLLAQSQLPAATVQAVQRVIASEATAMAGCAPASGYMGDTKAEENGWDSNVLALGAAWLSSNTNAALWLTAAKKYMANTYTVAHTNGDPLSSWITTVNLYPDFALENHGFYHPLYQMVAGMSLGDSLLMARLANPIVATQLQAFAEHNVLNVWSNENHLVIDSGEFAYPSGLDWDLHAYQQNSYIAWLATHFNDPLARWADGQLAQMELYRQGLNGNGAFVGPSGGGFYREAVEARRTAISWLHWAHADYPSGPTNAPAPVFECLPDVGIIAQRGPAGFVGLCYGPRTNGYPARIMAIIEPRAAAIPTNAYVTTPRLPGIIGLGALGKPTGARLVSLVTNANGFQAELQLTNGVNGTTEVYLNSTGETVGLVEVPWPASGVVGNSAGSFCVGIENDPLAGGSRLVEWTGGSATITNRSGASRSITNGWVCVAGRYGVTAGPAGYFNYQAATDYNRLGGAEDTLQFMPQSPLGPRYAVWFPGGSAAATMSNASQVSWTVSETNCVLTFPGAGGNPAQIAAVLPPPVPLYPSYLLAMSGVAASSWKTNHPTANAVDGSYTNFWVSEGINPGEGPTTNRPEWLLVAFPREVALSEFQVYPRTDNGGYGPKAVQMVLNVTNAVFTNTVPSAGTNVYQGTMAATATLDVRLSQPVYATNALLWITSSYDPSYPTNSRNVQVVEMAFFERALPGTYDDWALHEFSDAQLADPAFGTATADPDGDGVPNLAEFAMDGNPLVADGATLALQPLSSVPGCFAFSFQERKSLGDVQRRFESSTNLVNWAEVTPTSLVVISNLPDAYLRGAVFPAQDAAAYFRLSFSVQSGP
jgi:hypothetical protein